MIDRLAMLVLALSAAPAAAPTAGAGATAAPAVSEPGAPDPFPNACVDCHLNYVDRKMDVRIGTLMAAWREKVEPRLLAKARAAAPAGAAVEGRHPDAPGALASIPGSCLSCHGKASTRAPPFAALIHSVHLTGGAENHFVAMFEGKCTHCHKLDARTGRLEVPSAPER
jgi:hypothetical protein